MGRREYAAHDGLRTGAATGYRHADSLAALYERRHAAMLRAECQAKWLCRAIVSALSIIIIITY